VEWRELYQLLGERVFRMLHRMTGDSAQAEDLTHDTFIRVHESRHQYDGTGSLSAWVFRIAGNLARDEFRRRSMRQERLVLLHPSGEAPAPRDPELRMALEDALAALSHDHRTVVLLHDVDGYRHPEIAEMLDIAEGTSRARLSRARELLRVALRTDSGR
jgi:RNA polymerase sigma-70 factor (ECF subfamily)